MHRQSVAGWASRGADVGNFPPLSQQFSTHHRPALVPLRHGPGGRQAPEGHQREAEEEEGPGQEGFPQQQTEWRLWLQVLSSLWGPGRRMGLPIVRSTFISSRQVYYNFSCVTSSPTYAGLYHTITSHTLQEELGRLL